VLLTKTSLRRSVTGIVAAATVIGAGVVVAASIDSAATVSTPAERITKPVGDLAVVFDVGDVDRFVVEASDRAARRVGGTWGGNFRRPDGMQFEWVGEPRDQIAYPSNYCRNLTAAAADGTGEQLGVGALLAGDQAMAQEHPASP